MSDVYTDIAAVQQQITDLQEKLFTLKAQQLVLNQREKLDGLIKQYQDGTITANAFLDECESVYRI